MHTTRPRSAHAIDDVSRTVARDDTDVHPTAVHDESRAHDVLAETRTLTVLVTVILDGDHHLVPTHVEVVAGFAEIVVYGDLCTRRRETGADEKQPQPGLAWRLRSWVIKIQGRMQLRYSRRSTVTVREVGDGPAVEPRHVAQRVEASHRIVIANQPAQIERGAFRCRDSDPVDRLPFSGQQPVPSGSDSAWCASVRPEQFHRNVVSDPACSMH